MTCPNCLRPQATAADEHIWRGVQLGDDLPDDWASEDADHLCWLTIDDESHCEPPEWFAAVTPLEVQELRAQIAALTPTWRDGEPPANALVLRERADGELQAVHTIRVADRICIMHPSGDVLAWGNARWCPIAKPLETP